MPLEVALRMRKTPGEEDPLAMINRRAESSTTTRNEQTRQTNLPSAAIYMSGAANRVTRNHGGAFRHSPHELSEAAVTIGHRNLAGKAA